jgi:hypothetical protein
MILIGRSFEGFLGCELNYSAKNNEIYTPRACLRSVLFGQFDCLVCFVAAWASIKDVKARCPILGEHGRRYVA